jgi:hypothetical protein
MAHKTLQQSLSPMAPPAIFCIQRLASAEVKREHPQCGIKLHSGNFSAIGKILQEQLSDGKCLRLQVKEWREKRSLSQNALRHMWYAEISEYLINSGRTDATPEWVKRNLKKPISAVKR